MEEITDTTMHVDCEISKPLFSYLWASRLFLVELKYVAYIWSPDRRCNWNRTFLNNFPDGAVSLIHYVSIRASQFEVITAIIIMKDAVRFSCTIDFRYLWRYPFFARCAGNEFLQGWLCPSVSLYVSLWELLDGYLRNLVMMALYLWSIILFIFLTVSKDKTNCEMWTALGLLNIWSATMCRRTISEKYMLIFLVSFLCVRYKTAKCGCMTFVSKFAIW
jgi:hypothetical protein